MLYSASQLSSWLPCVQIPPVFWVMYTIAEVSLVIGLGKGAVSPLLTQSLLHSRRALWRPWCARGNKLLITHRQLRVQ